MNVDLFTVRHVFGGICGSYGIWNPECVNLSNTHLYSIPFFPFLFVENRFAFTIIILSFNLQDIEQNF